MDAPVFLKGPQVARLLNISRAHAYRLIARGEIPSLRFNRTVRVREADLKAFIAKNSVTQATQTGKVVSKLDHAG
jgi:excisionase family DNA binding protein